MDRNPRMTTFDPDLDVPRRAPTGPPGPIDACRRLVVNPLLTVAGLIGSILLSRASLQWGSLSAFLSAHGLLVVSLLLGQVHCLDCGATFWLLGSRHHLCERALARWREARPLRRRFPGVTAQVSLWIHILAPIAVLVLILGVSNR